MSNYNHDAKDDRRLEPTDHPTREPSELAKRIADVALNLTDIAGGCMTGDCEHVLRDDCLYAIAEVLCLYGLATLELEHNAKLHWIDKLEGEKSDLEAQLAAAEAALERRVNRECYDLKVVELGGAEAELTNPLGKYQQARREAVHWEEVAKGLEAQLAAAEAELTNPLDYWLRTALAGQGKPDDT